MNPRLHFNLFYYFGIILLLFNVAHCMNHLNNLKGRPGEGYYLEIAIGTPPQKLNVLVDTGSTNLAVAGTAHSLVDKYYKSEKSETYKSLDEKVWVPYTQGCWEGTLGSDLVSITSLGNLKPVRCAVASILSSTNFYMNGSHWQGILGLAYPSISRPTSSVLSWLEAVSYVSGHNTSHYHFRTLPLPFSLQLCGVNDEELNHVGDLIVGDVLSVPSPEIPTWMLSPIMREGFYELMLTGMQLGIYPLNLPCEEFNNEKTIVDSGTTELRLPAVVFQALMDLLQRSLTKKGRRESVEFWVQQKTVCWNRGKEYEEKIWLESFPNITLSLAFAPKLSVGYGHESHQNSPYPFHIDSYFNLEITSKSYIRRVIDEIPNHFTASKKNQNCYKFGIETSDTGTVLGIAVMEGFHIMFNQSGRVVGFAKSDCGPEVSISGPFPLKFDSTPCTHYMIPNKMSSLTMGAYIVGALISICGAVLLFLVCQGMWVTFRLRYLYLLIPSRKRNSSVVNLVTPEF